jgi:hypothetical protein
MAIIDSVNGIAMTPTPVSIQPGVRRAGAEGDRLAGAALGSTRGAVGVDSGRLGGSAGGSTRGAASAAAGASDR